MGGTFFNNLPATEVKRMLKLFASRISSVTVSPLIFRLICFNDICLLLILIRVLMPSQTFSQFVLFRFKKFLKYASLQIWPRFTICLWYVWCFSWGLVFLWTFLCLQNCLLSFFSNFHPLSANFTKWSNPLKQFVGKLATNCLSVFDHFEGLALKGLIDFRIPVVSQGLFGFFLLMKFSF